MFQLKIWKKTFRRPALKARVESGATAATTRYTSQYKWLHWYQDGLVGKVMVLSPVDR